MLQFINTERTIRLEQEIGTRSYTPKIKPSIVNLQCVVYSLRVICAMQIMSGYTARHLTTPSSTHCRGQNPEIGRYFLEPVYMLSGTQFILLTKFLPQSIDTKSLQVCSQISPKHLTLLTIKILFARFKHYGIRDVALKWIKSYFSCHQQFVQFNVGCSTTAKSIKVPFQVLYFSYFTYDDNSRVL